jgi:Ni,Fe-hydrogenase maturation factor
MTKKSNSVHNASLQALIAKKVFIVEEEKIFWQAKLDEARGVAKKVNKGVDMIVQAAIKELDNPANEFNPEEIFNTSTNDAREEHKIPPSESQDL